MSTKLPRQASLSSSCSDPSQRIKVLIEYGSKVEVDKTLAVKLYLRSGREMLRMANMFCDEGQLESAFILYYKFITLFLEKLPLHPDYRNSPPEELADFKRKVKKVFPLAEEIKSQLKKRYAEEEKLYIEEQKQLEEQRAIAEEERRKAREQQERQDAEMARKLQEEEEAEVRSEQEEKYWKLRKEEEEKMKESEKRKMEGLDAGVVGDKYNGAVSEGISAGSSATGSDRSGGPSVSHDEGASTLPPPPSYSQFLSDISKNPPQIPDRDLKKKLVINESEFTSLSTNKPTLPAVDRSKKPSIDHHLSLGEYGGLSDGQLRNIIVPSVLMSIFLAAAEKNTAMEAETMGILCGKMSQGKFRVTNLFIPQQKGGHDSCDMENEEELIYYQDEHNLITLGWIHTHPTQTAFLSSVDLHSHFPWQKMMPEAIAIVCSPKFQESGIFKLTEHGLDVIGSCQQKGFHPHNKDPPLFEICNHVELSEGDSVVMDDRRK